MKSFFPAAALILLVTVALAHPAAADEVPNPAYEAWKNFKQGARSTIAGSTKTMGMETSLEITSKLVEVTPQKVVVEVTSVMNTPGGKIEQPTQKQELPARKNREDAPAPASTETITVK